MEANAIYRRRPDYISEVLDDEVGGSVRARRAVVTHGKELIVIQAVNPSAFLHGSEQVLCAL